MQTKKIEAISLQQNKMMRQAEAQCLLSTKSKPFWLSNIANYTKTITASKLTTRPLGRLVRTKMSCHHLCTNTVTVMRSEPELVGPAKPTPREHKELSFLDTRDLVRMMFTTIQIYRYEPSMQGVDPARVIRDALAHALVFYYPLAGRLREGPDGRLSVDCTAEGVQFVEAEADVELAQLGDPPRPPFPWLDDFVSTSREIVDSPLSFIQVTRLKCGSFVLAICCNHVMCDGVGLTQFLTDVGEIARGAPIPSVTPVWKRELFSAPNHGHEKEDRPTPTTTNPPVNNNLGLIHRSIFFGRSKLLAIRMLVPEHLRPRATTFDLLTAHLWRCHASALELDRGDTTVWLTIPFNARGKTKSEVPVGYYGNASSATQSKTSAGRLCESPIEYAIGLVRRAKEESWKEYASWRTDRPLTWRPPCDYSLHTSLFANDIRRFGLGDVDYGWGRAAYGGLAPFDMEGFVSYVTFKERDGEDGILVSMCLQPNVMERFQTQVNNMLM